MLLSTILAILLFTTVSVDDTWKYPISEKMSQEYSYENAQKLLEYSYRVSLHDKDVWNNNPTPSKLDPPNFDVVIPFDTTILFTKVNAGFFFYSTKLDIVVISFTGTYNNLLILVDINMTQETPEGINNLVEGMKMHTGIYNFYKEIQGQLLILLEQYLTDETQVLITGSSLGGAMGSIASLDFHQRKLANNSTVSNLVHYSFSSPRVFNSIGASHFNSLGISSHRIGNGEDIIITIPYPIMGEFEDYMHCGNVITFDNNMGNYYDNHVTAYLLEYLVN